MNWATSLFPMFSLCPLAPRHILRAQPSSVTQSQKSKRHGNFTILEVSEERIHAVATRASIEHTELRPFVDDDI